MKAPFTLVVAALFAGAAAGYLCAGRETAPQEKGDGASGKAVKTSLDDTRTVEALHKRIEQLESALAEKKAAERSSASVAPAAVESGGPRRGRGPWGAASLEEIKRENPEAYTQITNHVARMRERRRERASNTLDFLASVDTSAMGKEARETHEALQELLERREKLADALDETMLSSGEDAGDGEERANAFREMMELSQEIDRLRGEERDNLLLQTANALGFEGEDAEAISETVKEIFEATGNGFGRPPRGPGRAPGGAERN